tara:strand:- start:265 stop:768 length:504 start_codon:yes stop_codon:yes gene_type:complete
MKKIEKFDQFNEKFVAVGFGMPFASASWSTPARLSYRDSAYDLAPIAGQIPDLSMGIAQQAHNYETNDNTQHKGDAYVKEAKGHLNEAIDQAWNDKQLETKENVKTSKVNEEYIESINAVEIANALGKMKTLWDEWKAGPMTEPSDIKPAQKELKGWIDRWFKQNIK